MIAVEETKPRLGLGCVGLHEVAVEVVVLRGGAPSYDERPILVDPLVGRASLVAVHVVDRDHQPAFSAKRSRCLPSRSISRIRISQASLPSISPAWMPLLTTISGRDDFANACRVKALARLTKSHHRTAFRGGVVSNDLGLRRGLGKKVAELDRLGVVVRFQVVASFVEERQQAGNGEYGVSLGHLTWRSLSLGVKASPIRR